MDDEARHRSPGESNDGLRNTDTGGDEATSDGGFSETLDPMAFSLTLAERVVAFARLAEFGNRGDHGVPSWSLPCPTFQPALLP